MFEKDADYRKARKESKDRITKVIKVWSAREETLHDEGFQEGAEFGFNKANEWHKPSEKLPKDCSLVLAYGFDDTEPTLYYYVASDTWEWMPKRIAVCSNNQIRLWKEIVLPKEIE